MSNKIVLENVRCSYVFVSEQRKKDNGEPGGYGVQILIPKDHKQVSDLKKLINKVLVDKVGSDEAKRKGRFKLPIRDADSPDEDKEGEEYRNMYFMNANSKVKKPGIVNRQGQIADLDDIEEYCYSGAYFHVSINVYYFPARDGGKAGIALGLNNIMLRKKGDRLDGSVSAAEDFSKLADSSDDFDDFDDLD